MLKNTPLIQRLWDGGLLAVSSVFCCAMSFFRAAYTGNHGLSWIKWNLFLAAIPWFITTLIAVVPKIRHSRWILPLLFGGWLLFFPNAPYIVTDLIYIGIYKDVPPWLEALHLISYAWTGLLFGFFSLWDIEDILQPRLGRVRTTAISVVLLFISGVGIYMGRSLRWNSWHIFTTPSIVFSGIWDLLVHPLAHIDAWAMSIPIGLFLNILYFSLERIRMQRRVAFQTARTDE